MGNYTFKQRMAHAFKKYGYYMLLGVLLLGFLLTIIIASANSDTVEDIPNNDNIVDTNTQTTMTYMPVLNASIYKGYYGDELVYNETLKQWETHNGIDFQVANGSAVYSISDGVVKDVYSNVLEGNVVVIEHEDGIVSTYASLDDNILVKEGDHIKGGAEIGKVSASATSESDAGAHLHFSMTDDGKKIDPAAYLDIEVK
ncbi:MAG: M23 family metallopeptidase [Clostridiales bacterium]|nr:M23 family metallopeptidase [Clostridiales bacterium]